MIWLFAVPVIGLFIVIIALLLLAPKPEHDGIAVLTNLLSVGEKQLPCVLYICRTYLAVTGFSDEHPKGITVPLTEVTSLLLQKKHSFTGWGIDHQDAEGPARLMFVNQGEDQEKRTRKILKAIQDAFVNMAPDLKLEPPPIVDVGRLVQHAEDNPVHRL